MRGAFVVGCVAAAMLVGVPAAMADQTLVLDTFSPLNNGFAGPVQTSKRLKQDVYYLVRVTGTFSIWSPTDWQTNTPACGSPESAPMFPSSGTTATGPVGLDADTAFGAPSDSHFCATGTLPQHQSNFQIDTGGGFGYVAPLGGPYSSPTAGHTYTYVLKGTGKPVTFAFRFMDFPTADNYGSLAIRVRHAKADDCHDRGWALFGAFNGEQGCERYVDSHRDDDD